MSQNSGAAVETIVASAKVTPPLTVAGLSIGGVPLSEIVLALTAVYTIAQIYFLFEKRVREWKKEKKEKDDESGHSKETPREPGDEPPGEDSEW